MGFNNQSTTDWKRENGLQSINFCMPIFLLQELDGMKQITGNTRSEMIRTAIRVYLMEKKKILAEQELKALEAYNARQQNQRRQVSTGLLPDY